MAAFSKECTRRVSFRDGNVLDKTAMKVSCNAYKQDEKDKLDEQATNDNLFSELHRFQGSPSHNPTAYTTISTGWMSSLSPRLTRALHHEAEHIARDKCLSEPFLAYHGVTLAIHHEYDPA